MRAEQLLEAIGSADEGLLERCERAEQSGGRVTLWMKEISWRKLCTMAACLAACVIVIMPVIMTWGHMDFGRSKSEGNASGSSGITMEEILVEITAWKEDGFEGRVSVKESNAGFDEGEYITVLFRENTAIVGKDGTVYTYGQMKELPAEWAVGYGYEVGDLVSVGFQKYDKQSGTIDAYHVEEAVYEK